jgi:hypothetical protein
MGVRTFPVKKTCTPRRPTRTTNRQLLWPIRTWYTVSLLLMYYVYFVSGRPPFLVLFSIFCVYGILNFGYYGKVIPNSDRVTRMCDPVTYNGTGILHMANIKPYTVNTSGCNVFLFTVFTQLRYHCLLTPVVLRDSMYTPFQHNWYVCNDQHE